jgi:tripartite-type tricarboxylate transporter receptor subunit TctC
VGCPAQGAAVSTEANYPTKPVRIIVPFAPGGTNDILGRMIATHLTETLGKTFIVDNRTGAEGIIGTETAVKAVPDGYTLVVLSNAYVMNPAVRKLPYDPVKALDFVIKLGSSATPLRGPSLHQLAQGDACAAKAKPGRSRSASGGFRTRQRSFAASRASTSTSCSKGRRPGPGGAGGASCTDPRSHRSVLPHLRSGKIKALAVGT